MPNYWLMKAEPDTRIVKGKDVRFSVDDFEECKTTPWEGVRNHEAKNLMKEMRIGDQILFYHSNCKIPGVAGFAKVSREAYPDHSAWDSTHPYFDAKTDKENPKWFMIDATFDSRAANHVPLALFKWIAALPASEVPEEISYIGKEGIDAIKVMDLVVRGRLSVQRVKEDAYDAVRLLAEKGGWDDLELVKPKVTKARASAKSAPKPARKAASKKSKEDSEAEKEGEDDEELAPEPKQTKTKSSKRSAGSKTKDQSKIEEDGEGEDSGPLSDPPSDPPPPKSSTRASTRKRKVENDAEEAPPTRPTRKARKK